MKPSNQIHGTRLRLMDIYSPKGTKVIYCFPESGYEWQQELARKHLMLGHVYTVRSTEVHSSSTEVFFEETGDIGFNSVLFGDLKLN